MDVDEKELRLWFVPLWLARQLTRAVDRLLILALVACTRLPGLPGDVAWRILEGMFERAMRDEED
jgi:hypothetical protein